MKRLQYLSSGVFSWPKHFLSVKTDRNSTRAEAWCRSRCRWVAQHSLPPDLVLQQHPESSCHPKGDFWGPGDPKSPHQEERALPGPAPGCCLLAAISVERCMSILCPLWYRCHRPQHLSAAVCALLWALSISVIATVTSLCLSHQQEQCRLALIAMYILNFLIFAPSMVISNVILLVKVLCGSKRRQPRRLYIAIFLTVLFFLLFGVPLSVWNFMQHFSDALGQHQVVVLLACINSSVNPFIYLLVGGGRRHCSLASLQVAFQRVFEETGVTVINT